MIFVQLNHYGLESTGKRSILHCGPEDFRDVFRKDFREEFHEDFKSQLNRAPESSLFPSSYLHACLAEVEPHCELLPGEDVRVLRPLERPLQLVQLERRERRPRPPHLGGNSIGIGDWWSHPMGEQVLICTGISLSCLVRVIHCMYSCTVPSIPPCTEHMIW